jgi:phosphohistidine phosphatase SixA
MIKQADLWLVRHGRSPGKKASNTDAQDAARVLSARGARQSVRASALLHKLTQVDNLYTSPRIRCRQTADLVGLAVRADPQVAAILDEVVERYPTRVLQLVKDGECSVVVGHGPEHHAVIRKLTGKDVWVKPGGLAHLTITSGQATLTQLLTPGDIKALL